MAALISEANSSYVFGTFLLIPGQQLLENEEAARIGGRCFDLLTVLVECSGQVVPKRELISRAWPGLVLVEGNLKFNIAALRRLLGEGPGPPRYIATGVGRGCQFIAPLLYANHPQALSPAPSRHIGSLPRSSQCIFGRETAIHAILHDLTQARLVSIMGPGAWARRRSPSRSPTGRRAASRVGRGS